jgi:glycosyltransferase involved in cell wall biosynthesis
MDAVVTTESRFIRDTAGRILCRDGTYGYAFWQRYLSAFDHVSVAARCDDSVYPVDRIPRGAKPVTGMGVDVWTFADSRGASGAIRRWSTWRHAIRRELGPHHAWILRMPGQIGMVARRELMRAGVPYAVEVVGDPVTVFSPSASRHPLRPWLRRLFQRELQAACREAAAVSYVTARHLQQRYPASEAAVASHYSSVELGTDAFVDSGRPLKPTPSPLRIVSVGTMSQPYKGFHLLIDAVARLRQRGLPVQVSLVGGGRLQETLRLQVAKQRITDCVTWCGQLAAGEGVRGELDRADLFVLASLTEGLPRAMIEAQARGLPCLGTNVGGIPELLESSELVPAGCAGALADAVARLAADPVRMHRLSAENLQRAHRYQSDQLQRQREAFYGAFRRIATGLDGTLLRKVA